MAGSRWALAIGLMLLITNVQSDACKGGGEPWYEDSLVNTKSVLPLLRSHDERDFKPIFFEKDTLLAQDKITWFYLEASNDPPIVKPLKSCNEVGDLEWFRSTEDCPFLESDKESCNCVDVPDAQNLMRVGVRQKDVGKCTLYIKLSQTTKEGGIKPVVIKSLKDDFKAALKNAKSMTIDHSHVWKDPTTTTTVLTTTTTTTAQTVVESKSTTKEKRREVAQANAFGSSTANGGISIPVLIGCFFGALLIGGFIVAAIVLADVIMRRRAAYSSASTTNNGVPYSATAVTTMTSKQSVDDPLLEKNETPTKNLETPTKNLETPTKNVEPPKKKVQDHYSKLNSQKSKPDSLVANVYHNDYQNLH